jgi:hypothetical protein
VRELWKGRTQARFTDAAIVIAFLNPVDWFDKSSLGKMTRQWQREHFAMRNAFAFRTYLEFVSSFHMVLLRLLPRLSRAFLLDTVVGIACVLYSHLPSLVVWFVTSALIGIICAALGRYQR